MKKNLYFLARIFFFPALVFFVNYGIYNLTNWYETIWWSDVVMHFLGGWSIAYGVGVALNRAEDAHYIIIWNRCLRGVLVLALVMTVAVFWEWYEFILDAIFQTHNQPSVADTMCDLFMGFLGALCGVLIVEWMCITRAHGSREQRISLPTPGPARRSRKNKFVSVQANT